MKLCTDKEDSLPVTQCVFRRVFKGHEPPLAIFKPKKVQCSVCNAAERTKTTDTDDKHREHIERKNSIKVMKLQDAKAAENNPKMIYGSFVLQAVFTFPFFKDCQIYYKRKLSLFNFTIFDSTKQGTCFLWDETNWKKGSSEIGTCLLNYISSISPEVEHVVLYVDTCGGQNSNHIKLACLIFAMNNHKYIGNNNLKKLDLKFMESGHSYLEVDSMH